MNRSQTFRRRWLVTALTLVMPVYGLLLGAVPAQAQGPAHPIFTRQAIAAAAAQMGATATASQDPRHDWSRLRQVTGSEIVLRAQGRTARRCRLVLFDDAGLTAVDLDSPNRTTLWIARADVDEVSQWIGRRGSVLGAVIGAGVGIVAGCRLALGLAFKQCGRSCSDEKFLIGLSLVASPIAGGFLGYRLPGDSRTLKTIYLRP